MSLNGVDTFGAPHLERHHRGTVVNAQATSTIATGFNRDHIPYGHRKSCANSVKYGDLNEKQASQELRFYGTLMLVRGISTARQFIKGSHHQMYISHHIIAGFFALLASGLHKINVQMDVEQLVRRAQAGDSEAVSILYQAYVDSIYRYILYRVGNVKDAEDLAAEVFVRMVEGLPTFRITEAPFAAWLFRIAASRVADHFREHLRHPHDELPETLADHDDLPEDVILQTQTFETVRNALSELSEEQQTILILRFVERRSHEDVAAILGKSVTAVKSAQHRALLRLTEILGTDQKVRHYLRGANG
jgi:RNA polymerase sigma-70 factor (ECF subfamily)